MYDNKNVWEAIESTSKELEDRNITQECLSNPTISPKIFVESFKQKWEHDFKNVSSPGFEQTWKSLCNTFNLGIALNRRDKDKEGTRLVLSPQTGTGKTEGLIHFAAMLWNEPKHPYILIVSRQIKECDRVANSINEEAIKLFGMPNDTSYATSFHSQSDIKLDRLKHYKVIVVTHEFFYQNHTKDSFLKNEKFSKIFNINEFKTRELVVIDESIDLIIEKKIDAMEIGRAVTLMERVRYFSRHRSNKALQLEGSKLEWLKEAVSIPKDFDNKKEFMPLVANRTPKEPVNQPPNFFGVSDLSFNETIKVLREDKDIRAAQILTGKHDTKNDKAIIEGVIQSLKELKSFDCNIDWLYTSIQGANVTWHTAKEIFPKGMTAIILDATAPSYKLYSLYQKYGKSVQLIPRVENVRSYKNATLYVARGHNTGKDIATPKNAQGLLQNLAKELDDTDKALIVCHKNMKPHLLGIETPFKYDVVNWGDLTGKNDWKDYNVCVIFGLNNKPPQFYLNRQILATDPVKVCTEFDSEEVTEENMGLQYSDLSQEVIQAINRVRCRNCIDQEGNCKSTRIYIALPNGYKGDYIVDSILDQMDDIV